VGLTHVRVRVANPAAPRRVTRVVCLVDSGAVYSVIPAATLRRLGITPHSTRTFTLADGTQIARQIGDGTRSGANCVPCRLLLNGSIARSSWLSPDISA
jgi:predicted aspartyl protease